MSKDLSAKYYHKNKEMLLSENKMYPDLLGEEKDKKKTKYGRKRYKSQSED